MMTKASGTSASTTPAPVAMPLPPLPLRKIEYMWPTTGAAAMKIATQGVKSAAAIAAGMYPLSMSQTMHDRAGLLAQHAEHVGGAHVARAVLAHVHAVEHLADDEPERDGPHQVGEDEQDDEAEHLDDDQRLPLKSITSGTPSRPNCARSRFST